MNKTTERKMRASLEFTEVFGVQNKIEPLGVGGYLLLRTSDD